jgi:hypothetical protein
MKISVFICGEGFTGEDLRLLLQGIRDQEQKFFPVKEIFMAAYADELTTDEMAGILSSLKPPFKQGPIVVGKESISRVFSRSEEKENDIHNSES